MKTAFAILLAAVAALIPSVRPAHAAPIFHFTDLSSLGGAGSEAEAINDAGQIVGAGYLTQGSFQNLIPFHAYLYSSGSKTDLGTLGGSVSNAQAINSSGVIVGGARNPQDEVRGFWYSNGVMQELRPLNGGLYSDAYAINRSGQIVGWFDAYYGDHALLYSAGTMRDLGTLGGQCSYAYGINDAGQIVGAADSSPFRRGPFLYSGGVITDLGSLGGGQGEALWINNAGQVVGDSYTTSDVQHAFLYSGGAMNDLVVFTENCVSILDRLVRHTRDLRWLDECDQFLKAPPTNECTREIKGRHHNRPDKYDPQFGQASSL